MSLYIVITIIYYIYGFFLISKSSLLVFENLPCDNLLNLAFIWFWREAIFIIENMTVVTIIPINTTQRVTIT